MRKSKEYAWLLQTLKRSSARRGYELLLTYEDLLSIIKKSHGHCHYCGRSITWEKYSRDDFGNRHSEAVNLDRKDNLKGYQLDNVVPCCIKCNLIKSGQLNYDEFMLLSPVLKKIRRARHE